MEHPTRDNVDEPPQIVDPGPPADLPDYPLVWPTSKDPPQKVYVIEEIRFDGTLDQFYKKVASYETVCRVKGWTRVLKASAITGNPQDFMLVWEVPGAFPPTDQPPNAKLLDNLWTASEFFDHVAKVERFVTAALPYDPAERPALLKGQTILRVRATVRDGHMPRLIALKQSFFKTVVETLGWKLFSAGYIVSNDGPSSTIIQCWNLESPENLATAMIAMAHAKTYTSFVAPCIVREDQQLYSVIG